MPEIDLQPFLVLTGALTGLLVGATGVGSGSLMTPILILLFGVNPALAIGSDILYAAITKTVGGLRHLRQGTVDVPVALWLLAGSAPASLAGVTLLHLLQRRVGNADTILLGLVGAVVLIAGLALVERTLRAYRTITSDRGSLTRRQRGRLVAIGAVVGAVLGMTSAGSGALIAIALLATVRLTPHRLIGTDVAHAALLLWVAGLAHLAAATVDLVLVANVLLGSIPAVWIGARLCRSIPGRPLRIALGGVMVGSGFALLSRLDLPIETTAVPVAVLTIAALLVVRRPARLRPSNAG